MAIGCCGGSYDEYEIDYDESVSLFSIESDDEEECGASLLGVPT